jgi:hypothetical protein
MQIAGLSLFLSLSAGWMERPYHPSTHIIVEPEPVGKSNDHFSPPQLIIMIIFK